MQQIYRTFEPKLEKFNYHKKHNIINTVIKATNN